MFSSYSRVWVPSCSCWGRAPRHLGLAIPCRTHGVLCGGRSTRYITRHGNIFPLFVRRLKGDACKTTPPERNGANGMAETPLPLQGAAVLKTSIHPKWLGALRAPDSDNRFGSAQGGHRDKNGTTEIQRKLLYRSHPPCLRTHSYTPNYLYTK